MRNASVRVERFPCDDLRTRSEAADRPQGVRGGKGRERREDGADDHIRARQTRSLCLTIPGEAGTVSRGAAASGGLREPRFLSRSDRVLWNEAPRSQPGAELRETTCDDCISEKGKQSL